MDKIRNLHYLTTPDITDKQSEVSLFVKYYPTFTKIYKYKNKTINSNPWVETLKNKKTSASIPALRMYTDIILFSKLSLYKHIKKHKQLNLVRSLRRTKVTIKDILLSNQFDLWVTFTFNQKHINRLNPDECKKGIQLFLNKMQKRQLRSNLPKLQYIIIPEYHKTNGHTVLRLNKEAAPLSSTTRGTNRLHLFEQAGNRRQNFNSNKTKQYSLRMQSYRIGQPAAQSNLHTSKKENTSFFSFYLTSDKTHSHMAFSAILGFFAYPSALHFHALIKDYHGTLSPAFHPKTGKPLLNKRTKTQVFNLPDFHLGNTKGVYCDNNPRLASYMTKYITKDMPVFSGKKRYWATKGLQRPIKFKTDLPLSYFSTPFSNIKKVFDNSMYELYYSDVSFSSPSDTKSSPIVALTGGLSMPPVIPRVELPVQIKLLNISEVKHHVSSSNRKGTGNSCH